MKKIIGVLLIAILALGIVGKDYAAAQISFQQQITDLTNQLTIKRQELKTYVANSTPTSTERVAIRKLLDELDGIDAQIAILTQQQQQDLQQQQKADKLVLPAN